MSSYTIAAIVTLAGVIAAAAAFVGTEIGTAVYAGTVSALTVAHKLGQESSAPREEQKSEKGSK